MLFKHLVVLLLPAAASAFLAPTSRSAFGVATTTIKSPRFLSAVEEASSEAAAADRHTIFVGNLPLGKSHFVMCL